MMVGSQPKVAQNSLRPAKSLESPVKARKREWAEHASQRTKASHERLAATTGLSGDDVRLRKHKLMAREAKRAAGWKWTPPPAGMGLAMASLGIAPGVVRSLTTAPRSTCQARTRRNTPCKALALGNGRCRNHGGLSTGPRTAEGWERTRAGYRAWVERQRAPSATLGVDVQIAPVG